METLEPLSDKNTVPIRIDGTETEFEVQAALYSALRAHGFDVRGEVQWCRKVKNARGEACRFDLVICKDGKAIHIVEVKAAPLQHRQGVTATRQGNRYRHFGVPVTFVYGGEDAMSFLKYMVTSR